MNVGVVTGESVSESFDSSPRIFTCYTGVEVYKASEGEWTRRSGGEGHTVVLEAVGDNVDGSREGGRENVGTVGGWGPDVGEASGKVEVGFDPGFAFTNNVKDGTFWDGSEFGELCFVGVEIKRFVGADGGSE